MKTPFALLIALSIGSSTALAETTQYWIYAGQSNLTGFQGLRTVVENHVPEVKLKEIRSGIPGTPIQSWLKDDPWQQRDKTGWKILLDALKKKGDVEIVGMVWYQGESNTKEDAPQYEQNLKTLIANVRELTDKPKLPVIVVQLATCRQDNWGWAQVREAQRRVAVVDPHVEVVCGLDLEIGDNNVHLSKPSKDEIGRRQGLAALQLVYGKQEITHGPQFSRAFFASDKRNIVVVEFNDVQGKLKLIEGWRQGFAAVEFDANDSPQQRESLIWPIHAEVVADNQVAVVFERPLKKGARIGWGMTPSACIGPHRRWDMPIQGVTDETGIPAIAFSLAEISTGVLSQKLVATIEAKRARNATLFDLTKPFQLAANGIGRSALAKLDPDEEAGAPNFRQKFWNGVHKGLESHLRDSRGLVTPIGIETYCWYANFAGTSDTPDQRLMNSYNRDRNTPTRIIGLVANEQYDIVLYHNMPDRPNDMIEYVVGTPVSDNKGRIKSVNAQKSVTIQQFSSTSEGEDRFAFVDYVECKPENKFTGNYYVFRDIKSDDSGQIMIWPQSKIKGARPRFTALQIIYHGQQR